MFCLGCAAKLLTDGWIQFLRFLVSYYFWWFIKYFKQFYIYCIVGSTILSLVSSFKEETEQVRLMVRMCAYAYACVHVPFNFLIDQLIL